MATPQYQYKKKTAQRKPTFQFDKIEWQIVGTGVVLLILAFVSAFMPEMDEMSNRGRGISRLIARLLFMLGPYAPLAGALLGLAGIALIVSGFGGIPNAIRFSFGGVASLVLVATCGLSFYHAMGFGSGNYNVAQSPDRSVSDIPGVSLSKRARQNAVNTARDKIEPKDKIVSPPRSSDRKPTTPRAGNTKPPKNKSGNPFIRGDSTDENDDDEKSVEEDLNDPANPFSSFGKEEDSMESVKERFRKRRLRNSVKSELVRRSMTGQLLSQFKRKGFSNSSVRLELTEFAGQEQRNGKLFYSSEPIGGIGFLNETPTILLPSQPGDSGEWFSTAESGEVVCAFNLNFKNQKLVGIQAIFAAYDGKEVYESNFNVGPWLGPETEKFETVSGNGKPIYGFLICQKGFDITGLQLIVEK